VWDQVAKSKGDVRARNSLSLAGSSSLNEELEDPKIQEKLKACKAALGDLLKDHPQAVGLITAINGKFASADLYDDPGLFKKVYPRLLESAAMASMSVKPDPKTAPAAEAASGFLAEADKGKSK